MLPTVLRTRVWMAVPFAVVASLLAASCTQVVERMDGALDESGAVVSARPCAAAAVRSCALPYPSDEFTVGDPTTRTGRRVEFPAELIPAHLRAQLGPGAGVGDAFGGADGFSAIGPIVFELDQPVRPESVPPDGGGIVAVYDEQTGERQAIRAHVWQEAFLRGAPGTIVMAWPDLRWEYGRTYVAAVRRMPGLLPTAPAAPVALRAGSAHLGDLAALLGEIHGVDPEEFISATRFTVRSRENSVGGLEHMAAVAGSQDHPVRNLVSRPPLFFSDGAAIVTGEVRITDFRDGNGVVDPYGDPEDTWIPFVLTLPARPAGPRGAPVAIYGHGLLANKETMTLVASRNAAKGVATIGIDVPNHGGRQAGQGGYLLDLTAPQHLGRVVGMVAQGIVDHVSLVRAINTSLAGIDLSPWRPFQAPGDGVADLDVSLLLYEGTSMGSVLGTAEVALNPEIDGAFFQVPGVGVVDIISHSMLWPVFRSIIPQDATAGDAAALLGAASMLLDRADATHLVERLADPERSVIAQVGIGDSIVPEFAAQRLLSLVDLPELEVGTVDIGGVPREAAVVPPDGRGTISVWPNDASPQSFGLMGHLSFDEPIALQLLSDWLDNRLEAAGFDTSG